MPRCCPYRPGPQKFYDGEFLSRYPSPPFSWFFEGFCGMWASGPRSVRQDSAAYFKTNGLELRTAPESTAFTRILEEPISFESRRDHSSEGDINCLICGYWKAEML